LTNRSLRSDDYYKPVRDFLLKFDVGGASNKSEKQ
jgi:hypothetical protein